MPTKDIAIFIGRFQPFHLGHATVVAEALKQAKKLVILVGGGGPRTTRNPFVFKEISDMIRSYISSVGLPQQNVVIVPLLDNLYNDDKWVDTVQNSVKQAYEELYGPWSPLALTKASTILIGHSKDHTSFYLKLFPQWGSYSVANFQNISSTDVREALFKNYPNISPHMEVVGGLSFQEVLTQPICDAILKEFIVTKEFKQLKFEYNFIEKYKSQWAVAPYPPIFVTVDAVVVQSGHILLIKRKAEPGKNLWAIPGGFLNQHEKILDAVIRELVEETKIKVPKPVLKGNIVKSEVFDDPNRSMRGRTITHAFLIQLPNDVILPKIRGSDDASDAKWVPLSEVKMSEMYDDHYHIIQKMLGK